ncbi:MAG TPA: septum site-determining protein MinC [Thermodesulfobacteriota bacterium]
MQIDLPKLDKRVVIKGYRTGIGIFFDEDGPFADLLVDLAQSLERSNAFFNGAPVTLHIGRRELGSRDFMALRDLLVERHRLMIAQVHADLPGTRTAAERLGLKVSGTPGGYRAADAAPAPGGPEVRVVPGGRDLARQVEPPREPAARGEPARSAERAEPSGGASPVADTLTVRQTLRSGQRIEFPGHVLVLGDVNSGAEIVAGGDIVVFGALRGLAHAGASGDRTAVIVALGIQPPQLRIGPVISRGSESPARRDAREPQTPEIARVEGDTIVVEAFRGRL